MIARWKFAMWLWVLAVALLPLRMANAHLHLCLDGQDAPIAVHVEDLPADHDDPHAANGHHDHDVDVSGSVTAIKASNLIALDYAVIDAYVFAILLPAQPDSVQVTSFVAPDLPSVFLLYPPSHGPPA
jgi:hypothetical protein